MQVLKPLTIVFAAACAAAAFADPCDDIVSDTVAEMRAGAAASWSADAERLVRAAAGSACVKAASTRYGLGPDGASTTGQRKVNTQEDSAGATATDAARGDVSDNTAQTGEASVDRDDGSWSMGGLTFRSMSGSPGKKPYERQRESNEDPDEDPDKEDSDKKESEKKD
jgi:hypothetical protein